MIRTKTSVFFQKLLGVIVLIVMVYVPCVYASDMTSASFIIRDPIVGTGGGYGSSASFQAFGSGDMTSIGRSTSASFEGRYGFLWYPYVTQGAFSATPNGANADLSWGASTAGLGWSVTGYNTGIKPSGGSYTYTARGLVTSYTYVGLTPGDYCFRLQTTDAFGYVIATSAEQCLTIQAVLTFSNDDATIGFGTLTTANARYATGDTLGTTTINTTAHTMTIGTNAPNGYTLTYFGPTLTSGASTIAPATFTGDNNGTPGTSQFALDATVTGTGTVTSGYSRGADDFKFVASTVSQVASASGVVSSDTVAVRYLGNISSTQEAGSYSTNLDWVVTGQF